MTKTKTKVRNSAKEEDRGQFTERGLRLLMLRKLTGMSIKALCEKYDIGYSTLRQWEHARVSGLSKKGAKKIIEAAAKEGVRCSLSWLLHGIGEPPNKSNKRKQIVPKPEDLELQTEIINEALNIKKEIEFFRKNHPHSLVLEIYDDGMEPLFQVGDHIGGIYREGEALTEILNLNCIVETEDYVLNCRRLTSGEKKNTYNLYCINPNTSAIPVIQTNVKVLRAAPISRLWRRIG